MVTIVYTIDRGVILIIICLGMVCIKLDIILESDQIIFPVKMDINTLVNTIKSGNISGATDRINVMMFYE